MDVAVVDGLRLAFEVFYHRDLMDSYVRAGWDPLESVWFDDVAVVFQPVTCRVAKAIFVVSVDFSSADIDSGLLARVDHVLTHSGFK